MHFLETKFFLIEVKSDYDILYRLREMQATELASIHGIPGM